MNISFMMFWSTRNYVRSVRHFNLAGLKKQPHYTVFAVLNKKMNFTTAAPKIATQLQLNM